MTSDAVTQEVASLCASLVDGPDTRFGVRIFFYHGRDWMKHYDLTPTRRIRALQHGAVEVELNAWLRARPELMESTP